MTSPSELTWLEAWQQPPSWQHDVVCMPIVGATEPSIPALYDSFGLLLGAVCVGFVALRALRMNLGRVCAVEIEDEPTTVEVEAVVVRSKSSLEAKDDVEAHTAPGKKIGRAG